MSLECCYLTSTADKLRRLRAETWDERPLPPDPDGMNGRRSEWAADAIAAFRRRTGADEEDALGDLLADLMHWCDRNDYDFDLALDRAKWHYEAETLGEDS